MLKRKERTVPKFKLFDVVELLADVEEPGSSPWGGAVSRGSLGAIVDELSQDHYIVEFGVEDGEDPALLTLSADLLKLREPS